MNFSLGIKIKFTILTNALHCSKIDLDFFSKLSRCVSMYWNTPKSLCCIIWKCFSCLLEEGIGKICKQFNYHNSFYQDRSANPAHMAAIFCPVLVCLEKAMQQTLFGVFQYSRNTSWSPIKNCKILIFKVIFQLNLSKN